ncbi:MAG TPA: cupin domain-containing protein [Planctomycetota bacterium]
MKTLLVVLAAATLAAQDAPVMIQEADLKWEAGPPSLPPGMKVVFLQGDMKKEGPFTFRAKLPADYKIPPHFHPGTEMVTVLSGGFHAALGDTFDASKAKGMKAGAFLSLPAKSPHFAFTKEETVIQVSGAGPWGITYVNPADDPRARN